MKHLRKLTAVLLVAATVLVLTPTDAKAAAKTPLGFVQKDNGIVWMYTDGSVLKSNWLKLNGLKWYFNGSGILQVGLVNVGNKTYLLYPDGTNAQGWQAIGDGIYYFNTDGSMVKNKTVDGFKIGADGKVVFTAQQLAAAAAASGADTQTATVTPVVPSDSKLAGYVNNVLASITNENMTSEQKLLACYNYVINFTTYKRTYETPAGDWTGQFAQELLSTGKGNCYRYAAAFAYLAKALGYDVKVCTGQVVARRGGTTPHGWAEVFIDGDWYVFDPELADSAPQDAGKLYKTTYELYPYKPFYKQAEWPVHF